MGIAIECASCQCRAQEHRDRSGTASKPCINSVNQNMRAPAKDSVRTRRRCRGQKKTSADIKRHAPPPPRPPPPPPPPPAPPPPPLSSPPIETWYAIFTEAYKRYYYCNLETGKTMWEPPASQGARVILAPPVVHHDVGGNCRAVTVRSRSTVVVSKDGKLRHRASMPLLRSRVRKKATTATEAIDENYTWRTDMPEKVNGGDPPGEVNQIQKTNETRHPSRIGRCKRVTQPEFHPTHHLASTKRPFPTPVHGTARQGGGNRGEIPIRQAPFECGKKHEQRKQRSCQESARLLISRRGEENSTRRCRKSRNEDPLVACGPPLRRGSCFPVSLDRAENWLAKMEPQLYRCRGSNSSQKQLVSSEQEVEPSRTSGPNRIDGISEMESPLKASNSCKTTTLRTDQVVNKTPRVATRLRGRAAAEWEVAKARLREDEEMTGKPEITPLGRSKQRSVDDLLLYKINTQAARQQKQNDKEALEDNFLAGRTGTINRSNLLVERMRRDGCTENLPASERLHRGAWEKQQRQENRQTLAEAAARRRSNPELTAKSRTLSRNRGEVAERLYEQAVVSREEALERERFELSAPRDATFHPKIAPRSASLALRRRKEGWGSGAFGDSAGGALVEEALLAEGVVYERRRQERKARKDQLAEVLRQGSRLNLHSKRLLREAESNGRARGALYDLGQGGGYHAFESAMDSDSVEQPSFTPVLVALKTSKTLLESRYGRDSVPSMAQRDKERELKRIERRARSPEGNEGRGDSKPARTFFVSQAGLYERTTEYARQNEQRRAEKREARLAEEMAGCTFVPDMPTRRMEGSRETPGAMLHQSNSSSGQILDVGEGSTSTDSNIWYSGSNNSLGSESPGRQYQAVECSSMGGRARERAQSGRGARAGDGGEGARGSRGGSLPNGWSAFISPGGREYYFCSVTGLVQWERPM